MRKIFTYLGASMVAIAALSSCNKELTNPDEDLKGGIPFEISAASVDTKTSMEGFTTKWVANDAINIFHAETGSNNYTSDGQFKITAENLDANKFKGTLAKELTADSYDWYAFYPYSNYNKTPAGSAQNNFGFTTIGGTVQTQDGYNSTAHLCGKTYPLYGVTKSVASNVAPTIVMNHLTSIIEVNVTNNSGKDLTVSNVSLTGTEDIVGIYYINFAGTPVVYTKKSETEVSNTVSLSVSNGTAIANGSSALFYVAVKPFKATSEQKLSLSVNGYSKEIPHSSDVTFTAGKIKKVKFNYDNTAVENNVTFDFSDPESLGLTKPSNGGDFTEITSAIVKGDVSLSTTNGGTTTRIYNSSGTCDLRVYKSTGSLTFSVPEGSIITKIVFTGNAVNSCSASVGTLSSGTWTGSNQSVKFTASNTLKISTATITYTLGKAKTSIIADDITGISARGESAGVLTYTLENPVDGTAIAASCDGTVVTSVVPNEGSFLYKVSANKTTSAREGTITLTYGDLTKVVKVSQLAPVFKVSRTSVELDPAVGSKTTITVTSDFDWTAEASTGAGFTFDPTVCEWNAENPYIDGKTMVTITASDENNSESGAKKLGTLTFTNYDTYETLDVTVTQKSSYVAPSTGTEVTFNLAYSATDTKSKDWSITNNGVTLYWKKGTAQNTPSPNKEGSVRMYPGTILTITVPEGKQITKVVFTATGTSYNATKLLYNNVALTSDTWKLATPANSVDLTATANARFKSIVVTYN